MASKIVMLTWDDGSPWPGTPGHDLPSGPVYPSHGLPGGGYPSHGLPGGGYPSHGLPGAPGHPSQPIYLPVFPYDPTKPVDPDKPPTGSTMPIEPGARFVLKCTLAFGLILIPDAEPKPEPKK